MSASSGLQENLRHLRVLLAVLDTSSITQAAIICNVSQPAVTQTIAKLERMVGSALFVRSGKSMFATAEGIVLTRRVRRAFEILDPALSDLSPRLRLTATAAQLRALIAVREAENFTLAARRMGIAQPSVHKAVSQLQQEAGRPLFERTTFGMVATRHAQTLAQAARLAFAELNQAEADLGETTSREVGRLVIGAMPLSRSYVLPKAIAKFRKLRAKLPIQIIDGPYSELLAGLRRGEIDFLIGALRDPAPISDVEQRELFSDTVVFVAGTNHPLASRASVAVEDLVRYPWVVAQTGTPIRNHFDALFAELGATPSGIVESSSVILMRELLELSDHLGCISYLQAEAEIARGLMRALPTKRASTARPIGLTTRSGWVPTPAQKDFLDCLKERSGSSAP